MPNGTFKQKLLEIIVIANCSNVEQQQSVAWNCFECGCGSASIFILLYPLAESRGNLSYIVTGGFISVILYQSGAKKILHSTITRPTNHTSFVTV